MPRTIRLRWIVAAAVVAIVTPLGVLAPLSVQRAWRRQLANVERQNVATVRAISVAIDQQIERTTAALDVLGELHALDSPDLPAFENLATRILPYQPQWSAVLLADTSGRVIDGVPDRRDGEARTKDVNWARAAFEARRTTVSGMFSLDGESGYFLMIAVPVIRDGVVTRVLGARVRTSVLSDTLRRQQTPPNGAVALIGADYRIIARTIEEEQLVGAKVTPEFIAQSQSTAEAAFRGAARDGTANYAAFSRSPRTGLTVGLGLPAEEVDGPIRRILIVLALSWIAVLMLGAGLGLALGHVIVRAMSSAAQAAMALARGEPVSPPPSRISEIDELAASLRRAADVLAERNRERDEASRLKDEFLMTISHELRTPLTAICGWARMLSSGQVRDGQRPKAVDSIERNAVALQNLVDELLDMSRMVAGKLRLEVRPVAMSELVAESVDAFRPAAVGKGIHLTTQVEAGGGQVLGDPRRLQQVVWNLLSNSVKFTGNGGRIEVFCRRAGEQIELIVRDTGIGIDADFLPHVFERFRQGGTSATRVHGGLGLGLSIVRDLVELHGGTVTAENNVPPPGATFRVMLPVASAAATYSAPAVWPPHAAPAASPTSPKTAAG